jgi:hypothetical protein
MGFEPMIPASERAKTVHALDSLATVTGFQIFTIHKYQNVYCFIVFHIPYMEGYYSVYV